VFKLKGSVGTGTKRYQQTLNKRDWETNHLRYQNQQRQEVIKLPAGSVGKARSKILTSFVKLFFFTFRVRQNQLGGLLLCHSSFVNEAPSPGRISISLCHQKICSACEQLWLGNSNYNAGK